MENFKAKVIIITGASRGIGAELAIKLAKQGHKIVINYAHAASKADALVQQITAIGGIATAYQADISQSAAVVALFDFTEQHFGAVDILINNAGIFTVSAIKDLEDTAIDQLIDINLKGTLYGMREAAKRLNHGGKIINISNSYRIIFSRKN